MEDKMELNEKIDCLSYAHFVEGSFLPIIWMRADGTIFKANNAVKDYLGYTKEEVCQLKIYDLDANFAKEDVLKAFELLRSKGAERFQSRHIRKDKKIINCEIVSTYFNIDDSEFAMCYMFDITDKVRIKNQLEEQNAELEQIASQSITDLRNKISELEHTKEKLRLSQEILSKAFKTSQDAITVNRVSDGVYIDINDAGLRYLKYDRDEIVGKSSLDMNIWADPKKREEMVEGVKKYGFVRNIEADFLCKDGSIITGLMSASMQSIDGGEALISVTREITREKQMERELQELNRSLQERVLHEVELRQKQESLLFEQSKFADMGQMINAIAHQWRQPLNALGLMVQDIVDQYEDNDLNDQYISNFESNSSDVITYMSETIDQFRNFFKTDSHKTNIDILATVVEVFRLIDAQISIKSIRYRIIFNGGTHEQVFTNISSPVETDEPIIIEGFQGEVKQALLNLIYNAVDSITERHAEDKGHQGLIEIKIAKHKVTASISVKDNGTGIPEQIIEKIFTPYFTTKEQQKGTGIGLYMTKLIVEKHSRGSITAKNHSDGAIFSLKLPLKQ